MEGSFSPALNLLALLGRALSVFLSFPCMILRREIKGHLAFTGVDQSILSLGASVDNSGTLMPSKPTYEKETFHFFLSPHKENLVVIL